ncbi:hypothetical protein E2C01_069881 [Portunus trituberculatus]|uniref:Uncharacterized protein n=1 Tax=Portunus trituberculatus TaxID=210409 RepID=A0A5B7HR74_PORTR|nr:hypothetical protein [Portunus trituberculatus]
MRYPETAPVLGEAVGGLASCVLTVAAHFARRFLIHGEKGGHACFKISCFLGVAVSCGTEITEPAVFAALTPGWQHYTVHTALG